MDCEHVDGPSYCAERADWPGNSMGIIFADPREPGRGREQGEEEEEKPYVSRMLLEYKV